MLMKHFVFSHFNVSDSLSFAFLILISVKKPFWIWIPKPLFEWYGGPSSLPPHLTLLMTKWRRDGSHFGGFLTTTTKQRDMIQTNGKKYEYSLPNN
jgi:hypothetical protein